MEEMRKTLQELKEKGSKIGINDTDKAAKIIYDIYVKNNDKTELIESLLSFNYKIIGSFVAKYLVMIDEKEEILNLIFINKKYKEKITYLALSIITKCLNGVNTESIAIKTLLNICTEITLTDKYNKIFGENMYKIMTESSYRLLSCDFSNLSLNENKKIYRCFQECLHQNKDQYLTEKVNIWSGKYISETEEPNNVVVISEKKEDKKLNEVKNHLDKDKGKNIDENIIAFEKLNKLLVDSNNEIDKLFNKVFIKNQTLIKLEEALNLKNNELNEKIEENKLNYKRVLELEYEMNKLKATMKEKEEENIDLRERLKLSFSADEISKNQEIVTLKNNISKSIRLQYDDFIENSSAECTEDNYEALKVIINQVFRALKKYGIEF